jgi:hypothetical protein
MYTNENDKSGNMLFVLFRQIRGTCEFLGEQYHGKRRGPSGPCGSRSVNRYSAPWLTEFPRNLMLFLWPSSDTKSDVSQARDPDSTPVDRFNVVLYRTPDFLTSRTDLLAPTDR